MSKLTSIIREMEYYNRTDNHYSCHLRIIEILKLLIKRKRKARK